MSRFTVLCGRLLERRLLGDGEAHASVIPSSFLTMSMSLLVFALLVPERTEEEVALYVTMACLVWAGVKGFLEADDLEAAALDRAVLEPLPIPRPTIAAARGVVVAAGLLLSTANLALPPAVLVGVARGPAAGALLLVAAGSASLAGLAFALASRVAMQRALGGRGTARLEGPIRLMVAVGLFAVVFVAPDFSALLERWPGLRFAPPFSLASLGSADAAVPALATLGLSVVALLAAFRIGSPASDPVDRGPARAAGGIGRLGRWFVREDERCGYEFAAAHIARDRTFRSRSYPLFAFPFAVTILLVERPDEPTLALLALYGAAVYLSVAQLLFPYTESPGGAALFRSLPFRDPGPFRCGSEKAFLVGVGLPVYLALTVALLLLSAFGYGFPLAAAAAHAVLGGFAAALVAAILFQRIPDPAFSLPDEGAYAKDLNGPMVAILLAGLLGVGAYRAAQSFVGFLAAAVGLAAALTLAFAHKRRRAVAP
ncbi:MAG: hypothetical protein ACF8XB_01240 [Planctomycetota bacterium JB042]